MSDGQDAPTIVDGQTEAKLSVFVIFCVTVDLQSNKLPLDTTDITKIIVLLQNFESLLVFQVQCT